MTSVAIGLRYKFSSAFWCGLFLHQYLQKKKLGVGDKVGKLRNGTNKEEELIPLHFAG
jgi:hypothetical protein